MKKVIAVKNSPPCSGVIQLYKEKEFDCAYCAWSSGLPDFDKLGWKKSSSWHPTYVVTTNSLKVIQKSIDSGLNRFSEDAYFRFFGKKPKKIIDEKTRSVFKNYKKANMKIKLSMFVMMFVMVVGVSAQSPCLTMEQTQAQYNQWKANGIVAKDTYTQQLQCHYQQLAVYWNQVHKDKQQAQKTEQQLQKDIQQRQKDEQQIAADAVLAERLAALQIPTQKYDELVAFIEVLLPLLGTHCIDVSKELVRIHRNRSGHADGTSPGGQTHNINGFENPGYIIAR